jgi:hypothetical protein
MDLTVRKGEQVTHPFDEFLQKATLTPTMKPSQHPICRQAPLSCRRVCKRKCAGLDSLHNPRNSPHMSCQIKPTCALFRDGRRLTVMAEARSISTRSVLTAHCHSYRTPRRHLRLCVCLALLLPFPIDIHHPMMVLRVDGRAGQAVRIPRCSLVLRAGAVCRFMAQDRRWSMRSTAGAAGRSDGADRWVLTYDLRSLSSSRI